MKKRLLMSAICAAVISLCAVASMNAQGGGAGAAAIPQLQYRLVEDFFHYPANSVVGRTTGVAINPKTGNICLLYTSPSPRD